MYEQIDGQFKTVEHCQGDVQSIQRFKHPRVYIRYDGKLHFGHIDQKVENQDEAHRILEKLRVEYLPTALHLPTDSTANHTSLVISRRGNPAARANLCKVYNTGGLTRSRTEFRMQAKEVKMKKQGSPQRP